MGMKIIVLDPLTAENHFLCLFYGLLLAAVCFHTYGLVGPSLPLVLSYFELSRVARLRFLWHTYSPTLFCN